MPRHRFAGLQIPGARTRRFLDGRSTPEWQCLEAALLSLETGRREFHEDPNLPDGGYYLEACGFIIWFTAPVLGGMATVTQVRYLPELPE